LISSESDQYCKDKNTDLDTLEGYQTEGIDTIVKALEMQAKENPNQPFLGTRVENKYQWMTYKEVRDYA
jgi:hypothetical protein